MAGAVIRISGQFDDAALKKASLAVSKFGMKVEGTSRTTSKSFDGLRTRTVALGAAIARVGVDMAYAFGRRAWDFLKTSITSASDLNETLSKTKVVFGDASKEVINFAKHADTAFGQSQQQALDAASNFGIFGNSAGLTGKDLTGFSIKLSGLASDLASFNNTSVDDAITALSAGLRGESEPLRKYGVLLDDATLRQAAVSAGIVKTTKKALTPQQRVLAAYNVILKQTRLQQGDFGRTSSGLANQQRILAAQFINLKTQLGQFFLPIITKLVSFLTSTMMPAFQKLADQLSKVVGPAIEALTPIFKSVGDAFSKHGDVILKTLAALVIAFAAFEIGGFIAAFAAAAAEGGLLATALVAIGGPVAAVALGIAALAGIFIYAYNTSQDFRDKVSAAFKSVNTVTDEISRAFHVLADVLESFLKPAFEGIKAVAMGIANFFISVFKGALDGLANAWGFIADALERNKEPLQAMMNFFGRIVEIVGKVLGPILSFLGEVVGTILKAAFTVLGIAISATIDIIGSIIRIVSLFGDGLFALKDGALTVFDAIKGFVSGLWDKLVGFKNDVVGFAKTIFSPLYEGFKSVVNSIIGAWNQLDFAINITVPDWVPLVGGKGFHVADIFPDIPMLAKGGIVTSPTLAMIGEAGPEAVIPLSRGGNSAMGSSITIQPGAIQVSIGSLDGMGRSDIQSIVDDAFQKSIAQLARDIRTRR